MQLCRTEQCPALQYCCLGIWTDKRGVFLRCSRKYGSPEAQIPQLPVLAARACFSLHTWPIWSVIIFLAMPAKRSYPSLKSAEKRGGRRESLEAFGGLHQDVCSQHPLIPWFDFKHPHSWARVKSSSTA